MKSFTFLTQDAIPLFGYLRVNENHNPIFIFIHGLHSHSERYSSFLESLIEKNYSVAAFDLRGHGRSEGKRGHTPSYQLLLDDIERFISVLEEKTNQHSFILCGHSLGGNLVLNYVAQMHDARVQKCIALAPFLKVKADPPSWTKPFIALRSIVSFLFPTLSFNTGLISKESADKDPLLTRTITAKFYTEVIPQGRWLLEHVNKIKIPTLLLHERDDTVTSAEASIQLAKTNSEYISAKILEGKNHNLLFGDNAQTIRDATISFLKASSQ